MGRSRIIHRLLPLLGLVLFVAAIWILHRQVRRLSWRDVADALGGLAPWQLLWAGAFTLLGYGILTGYDFLALRYIGHPLRYPRAALAAFVGYSFSNNIGHSFLTGGAVRLRLYSAWGLSGGEVAQVIVFAHITFYVGLLLLIGAAGLIEPRPIASELGAADVAVRLACAAMLVLVAAYFVFTIRRRDSLAVGKWRFPIPSPGLTMIQLLVGSLDMALVACVLWSLLPHTSAMTFSGFLGLFLVAQVIGMGSQVPGGLGVFESIMLHVMTPEVDAPQVLAALLVYRLVYYIIPLALGAMALAAFEIQSRRRPRSTEAMGNGQ